MSAPSPIDGSDGDLVARLRAAGCVFAEEEAHLLLASAPEPAEREALVRRRIAGEPLEHVLGRVQFCGLPIRLGPGVFVPRRRSELLVRTGLADLATRSPAEAPFTMVELCCGAAAIASAMAWAIRRDLPHTPSPRIHAVDHDEHAAGWARANLAALGPKDRRVWVHVGDLYAPLPHDLRGAVDLIVAVPPYVPTADLDLMPAEARLHEPRHALDGGPDGLDVARRILLGAPQWLSPGGRVLLECGRGQSRALMQAASTAGLDVELHRSEEPEGFAVSGSRSGDPLPGGAGQP